MSDSTKRTNQQYTVDIEGITEPVELPANSFMIAAARVAIENSKFARRRGKHVVHVVMDQLDADGDPITAEQEPLRQTFSVHVCGRETTALPA